MKHPIKNTYPPDLTVGTNKFFVNTNIIEHQHVAGVESPLLRIIENTKQGQDGKLLNTSTTAHKVITELQFEKLITSTIGRKSNWDDFHSWTESSFRWYRSKSSHSQVSENSINGTILGPTCSTTSFLTTCTRQRGSGFGSLAAGVGRVALPFARTFLLPAVKSIGKEFLLQSIPELLDVASKKKTSKQAVQSAVRKTVKKQLGGSKRKRRGKQFIRREKWTQRSRSDFFSRFKNVDYQ